MIPEILECLFPATLIARYERRSKMYKQCAERRKTSSDTAMSPKLLVVSSVFLVVAQAKLMPTRRVFGGQDAEENEFPYQISLQTIIDTPGKMEHMCGGSVLSDQWVLTAAHCVSDNEDRPWNVVAGTNNLARLGKDAQTVPVDKAIVHESWQKKCFPYDLALLKLKTPLTLNKAVSPISLPKFRAKASGNGTISGFGLTEKSRDKISTILKKADVLIIDHAKCVTEFARVLLSQKVHPKGICTSAGDWTPISACTADSGGPLSQKKPSGVTQLLGVVSWGVRPCGGPGIPSVYVSVAEFVDWIQTTMKKN